MVPGTLVRYEQWLYDDTRGASCPAMHRNVTAQFNVAFKRLACNEYVVESVVGRLSVRRHTAATAC